MSNYRKFITQVNNILIMLFGLIILILITPLFIILLDSINGTTYMDCVFGAIGVLGVVLSALFGIYLTMFSIFALLGGKEFKDI